MSFEKWYHSVGYLGDDQNIRARISFEAGQQSKQAEVDELRKRIDEINNHVEINYDENRDDDSHSYWSGYNQALRELFEILKGDQS